jgi:alpha-beta hydrolase superfamily lysophospholipase
MEELISIHYNGQNINGSLYKFSEKTLIIVSPGFLMTRSVPIIKKALKYLTTLGPSLYIYDSLSYTKKPFYKKIAPVYSEKLSELISIIEYFQNNYHYKNIIVMGVSLGALLTVAAAKHVTISGVILLNGFLDVHKQLKRYPIEVVLFNLFYKKVRRLNTEFFKTEISHTNISTPILVLHGTSDRLLDYKYSEKFYNSLKILNKKLHLVPNADHFLSQKENMETVTNYITQWLKENRFL